MTPPDWILCFRHAEKRIADSGHEIPGLSVAGEERSRLLAEALDEGGHLLPHGASAPSQILVPDFNDNGDGRRPYDTVAPLAMRLAVERTVRRKDDVGGLADCVRGSSARVVVICWEHDALAAWLQRFAGQVAVQSTAELPVEWPKDHFDILWQLHRSATGGHDVYEFTERPQGLPVEEVYDAHGHPMGFVDVDAGRFVPQTRTHADG